MLHATILSSVQTSTGYPANNSLVLPPRPHGNLVSDLPNSIQIQSTPDPAIKEKELKTTETNPSIGQPGWFKNQLGDSVMFSLVDYVFFALVCAGFYVYNIYKASLRKFHDQISIEIPGFCNLDPEGVHPALYFQQFQPEDLSEILDPSAKRQVKKAIKASKKDLLPFIIFNHKGAKSPQDIIGREITRWAENFLGETVIDVDAPKERLINGIQTKDSADVIKYFGVFTCDELGSTEQLCVVPIQAEELLNVLIDLPRWWKATEQESKLDERDSKIRLARIVEFAVTMAVRYPLALKDCLKLHSSHVDQAIECAKRLEKLLAILPKDVTRWLDNFLKNGYFESDKILLDELKLSTAERLEVMKDWFCIKNEQRCRQLAAIEKSATSFDSLTDISVENRIPMWFIMPRKYLYK